jgi:glycosyltransferase involved in cell wall biosynthesis
MDVLICGDVGLLPTFVQLKARLKIMNLLGSRFADKYRRHYRDDMVVVGNSAEWKQYFPGVQGYTIAGAVNTSVFKPLDRTDHAQFRVICFGRNERAWKGTRFVVKAVRRLRPRKDYRLVMFDNKPQRKPWFVNAEMHHGLTQEQLARLYGTADVFVSAEYGAGWSNTSAEAMACGVPLVCTDSGTQDFAIDGETAIVVPHGDIAAIAAAVSRLKHDQPLRGRLIQNGLTKIQEFT